MGIHVEIFLKKALKQVKCLKNQEKVEPGQCRLHIWHVFFIANLDYSIVQRHKVFPHTCKRIFLANLNSSKVSIPSIKVNDPESFDAWFRAIR